LLGLLVEENLNKKLNKVQYRNTQKYILFSLSNNNLLTPLVRICILYYILYALCALMFVEECEKIRLTVKY